MRTIKMSITWTDQFYITQTKDQEKKGISDTGASSGHNRSD